MSQRHRRLASLWRFARRRRSLKCQRNQFPIPTPKRRCRLGPLSLKSTVALNNVGIDTNVFNAAGSDNPAERFHDDVHPRDRPVAAPGPDVDQRTDRRGLGVLPDVCVGAVGERRSIVIGSGHARSTVWRSKARAVPQHPRAARIRNRCPVGPHRRPNGMAASRCAWCRRHLRRRTGLASA